MHLTPAKLVDDGAIAYTLFANITKKLAFFYNLSSVFTASYDFDLLNIYS